MPQFFMYTTPDPDATAAEPSPELFEEMDKLIAEGVCQRLACRDRFARSPRDQDRPPRRQVHADRRTVHRGQGAVVGWAIVKVDSKEEAVELSKRFWR